MKRVLLATLLFILAVSAVTLWAGDEEEPETAPFSDATFAGLRLRSVGPAVNSGRIADFAVDPMNRSRYYVAAASGGVWKTENAGTTWAPLFDGQGSYSIGCVTLDPNNSNVVWVGSGENNSQRSVSYGDGVYRSDDGGVSWENMGLGESEHIAEILVDPRDSDVVYVSAQGPLWRSGGDRGLYKSTDGGENWKRVLEIDENTGTNDAVMDPRNPDVIYVSAWQRGRRVWTLIDGGPGSALYKTTDGGETWSKLTNGLPSVEMGRIGLAISPANPDVLYAVVEAAEEESGVFRSSNRGATWEKVSGYKFSSPQYYNEVVCDPVDADRIYLMDTWAKVSDDGGRTYRQLYKYNKHVDDHAMWIDPENTNHYLLGCDGGVYESFDRGAAWAFKANLPITQFYRVSVDESKPFYYVYGGTQDNATLGGPSRTINEPGIVNADWYVPVYGDGFKTQVDPKDPDTVYSESQYGGLVRHDRKSGELVDIKPREGKGEKAYRWNWNSPLIISPHSHTRLYFAANILFRSDDRGHSWRPISGDLSRQLDRNKLPVMGKVWGADTVAKHHATSPYGNIVALTESPLAEGLLYAGTDDGLIQVTEDGGESWRKVAKFPGVPDQTYVSCLAASLYDPDTVYACFDDHKRGNFKPYILESTDRGRSWNRISGDLPERGSVHALVQDHVKADLLFAGTEFGLHFTVDGGKKWLRLGGGMPTIAVRDLAVQRRENDLVLASFGRGIYILDDYSPLRGISETVLEEGALLFPVKDAWMYMLRQPLGLRGKASQGDAYFTAENPPYGAVFTYYLKDGLKTKHDLRKEAEEENADRPHPSLDELRAEADDEPPVIQLTVRDQTGNVISRLNGPATKGIHRVAWDLRYPASSPVSLEEPEVGRFSSRDAGPMAAPGTYTVELARREGGLATPLADPVSFDTVPLGLASMPAEDREAVLAFQRKAARLQRAVLGAQNAVWEAEERIQYLKKAVEVTPGADITLASEVLDLEARLREIRRALGGDEVLRVRSEPQPPSISQRVQRVVYGQWFTSTAPTETQLEAYRISAEEFGPILGKLQSLIEVDLAGLESTMERLDAPWTPGRVPRWQAE